MPAVRGFILGGGGGLRRKIVCAPSLIERALVTLAGNRALLLVGEPGPGGGERLAGGIA
jgi:MoxR-like ATPase